MKIYQHNTVRAVIPNGKCFFVVGISVIAGHLLGLKARNIPCQRIRVYMVNAIFIVGAVPQDIRPRRTSAARTAGSKAP